LRLRWNLAEFPNYRLGIIAVPDTAVPAMIGLVENVLLRAEKFLIAPSFTGAT
jgi:hypothetical protein